MRGGGDIDWSKGEMITTLRQLWAQTKPQLSAREIGERMGVSKCAVVGKVHRLDLPPRPSPILKRGHGETPPRADRRKIRSRAITLPSMEAPLAISPSPGKSMPAKPKIAPPVKAPPPMLYGRVTQCSYPLTDGKPWKFCDEATVPGKAMCEKHHAACFVRVRDRREDAA